MKQKKFMLVLGFIVLASLIMSACQPIVTTVEVVKEVTKEVKVVETNIVKVESTKVVNVETTKIVEVQRKAFTTPHPILGDLKVRQAMAYCTNKLDLIKSVYPLVNAEAQKKLVLNSFIDGTHWAYAGDANLTIYPFDKTKGSALLEEAGWALDKDSGLRSNKAGEALSLKFTTTNASFRQTWAAVWEKQMKDCGVAIVRFHVPSTWWFGDNTGLKRRDFELGAFAWVGEADPSGQTLYACDQIPSPDNGWAGQNDMGWCNEKASKAIKLANNTLLQKDRAAQYLIVQQEYTKDIPALPLFNRTNSYAYNPKLTGFNQAPGNIYWDWNIETWEIPGKDTIVIGLTQEPSTLYQLIVDAVVARISMLPVSGAGGGFSPSLNYTYTANMYYKQLPTIENGGAKNNDVDVKEGDKVVDADGNPVDLKAGVKIMDSTGAVIEYKSGTVKMKQLVITYDLEPGIKWSDGKPLVKADLELGYKNDCDKDSGATSYITCDKTAKYEVKSDVQTVLTYKPGVQSPLYYLPTYGWYPSHRVIADGTYKGKTLAEVPAKEWSKLKEISENPIDTGPYMIKEWKKGQSISYEANPNFYKGKPKTPKLVVKFIDPANAEAQLISGEVDILGDETLTAITETLDKAEKAGKVKTAVIPSATWEHIDFSLFVK